MPPPWVGRHPNGKLLCSANQCSEICALTGESSSPRTSQWPSAGSAARRLGGDKSLLEEDVTPVFVGSAHKLGQLHSDQCTTVLCNCPSRKKDGCFNCVRNPTCRSNIAQGFLNFLPLHCQ